MAEARSDHRRLSPPSPSLHTSGHLQFLHHQGLAQEADGETRVTSALK